MFHKTNSATLHLHYDIEKPGYHGLDRRHYPEKHRFSFSESVYKPRGRAHIPSPPLEDEKWRPHGRNIRPHYSNVGPDWHSRLRYIRSPHNPDAKPTLPVSIIEQNLHFVRAYPQNYQRSTNEWTYFTDESPDHRPAKRNLFANIHLRSIEDLGDENVHMTQIGHKRKVYDVRNGLPKRSDGDKSYRRVEFEPDFHKLGSTLPAINFGHMKSVDELNKTFIPMKNETLHVIDDKEFEEKERKREYDESINEVHRLDNWKPAECLKSAFNVFPTSSKDKRAGKRRGHFR
ncbi:unnamed protein product [Adineta steineri]|uniref:Uncharacterized protein n=1 Tax=Adineta steineri TaxID=433720 RepID=A0A813UL88_9BILA|nr:unnamed protein product [Adineta steineri]CAF1253585.1 unnamed protein product [Adineta steineri]CAF1309895.1 unnamed protein product [Adineta steineri]CAF1349022.1 unnamed protein product [Adineta steineri]CAF4158791.1 unnamed protein product [Adineta steineri]